MDAFGVAHSGLTSSSNESPALQYRDQNALFAFNTLHHDNPRHRCEVCNNLRCHDEFAVKYLQSKFEDKGMKLRDCYDRSEQDIINNTRLRQVFYEDYWKISRDLYNADQWTS